MSDAKKLFFVDLRSCSTTYPIGTDARQKSGCAHTIEIISFFVLKCKRARVVESCCKLQASEQVQSTTLSSSTLIFFYAPPILLA